MLPPVLEIYVVWHPGDAAGRQICDEFLEHFHGTAFSGLIGGAIEVYARSAGWNSSDDAPRPIAFTANEAPGSLRPAQYIAVVPILATDLAAVVQQEGSAWRRFAEGIMAAKAQHSGRVGVFPLVLSPSAVDGTVLGEIFASVQRIAANPVKRRSRSVAVTWLKG